MSTPDQTKIGPDKTPWSELKKHAFERDFEQNPKYRYKDYSEEDKKKYKELKEYQKEHPEEHQVKFDKSANGGKGKGYLRDLPAAQSYQPKRFKLVFDDSKKKKNTADEDEKET